jgi:hypothetical protein
VRHTVEANQHRRAGGSQPRHRLEEGIGVAKAQLGEHERQRSERGHRDPGERGQHVDLTERQLGHGHAIGGRDQTAKPDRNAGGDQERRSIRSAERKPRHPRHEHGNAEHHREHADHEQHRAQIELQRQSWNGGFFAHVCTVRR